LGYEVYKYLIIYYSGFKFRAIMQAKFLISKCFMVFLNYVWNYWV